MKPTSMSRDLIQIILMMIMSFICDNVVAQSDMVQQEKYIDAKVAKHKNDASYHHISVLGCNLGNTYEVFCENLKKIGFHDIDKESFWKGKSSNKDVGRWKGKMSNRDVGLQINVCGKYITSIYMFFACDSEDDKDSTFRNIFGSLNKKYGKFTRESKTTYYWEKYNVKIQLYSVSNPLHYIIKSEKEVCIDYEDLIYTNWIKEYENGIKQQKLKKERKTYDDNL